MWSHPGYSFSPSANIHTPASVIATSPAEVRASPFSQPSVTHRRREASSRAPLPRPPRSQRGCTSISGSPPVGLSYLTGSPLFFLRGVSGRICDERRPQGEYIGTYKEGARRWYFLYSRSSAAARLLIVL